jgi:hypothetical protein
MGKNSVMNTTHVLISPIQQDQTNVVQHLLNSGIGYPLNGPQDDQKRQKNKIPLILASMKFQKDIVRVLLDKGATINITDETGKTPLHYVVLAEPYVTLPWSKTKYGYSSTRYNKSKEQIDTIRYLLKRGAKILKDKDGNTPLDIAIQNNKKDIAVILLQHMSLERKNIERMLQTRGYGHKDIIQELVTRLPFDNMENQKKMWFLKNLPVRVFASIMLSVPTREMSSLLNLFMATRAPYRIPAPSRQDPKKVALLVEYLLYDSQYNTPSAERSIIVDVLVQANVFKIKYVLDYLFLGKFQHLSTLPVSGAASPRFVPNSMYTYSTAHINVDNIQLHKDGLLSVPVASSGIRKEYLEPIFQNTRVKFTDAIYPFHVLVVSAALPNSIERINSSAKMKQVVDHLLSQKFDINAVSPIVQATPIGLLEKIMDKIRQQDFQTEKLKTNSAYKRLHDLHSIFVSRGALTSTGRKQQRDIDSKKKKLRDYVKAWSTENYQEIQNARRSIPPNLSKEIVHKQRKIKGKSSTPVIAERINRYLAQTLRDRTPRAPTIPRNFTVQYDAKKIHRNARPKYLFRGIHGPQMEAYLRTGILEEKGYIPFSRMEKIAKQFAQNDLPDGGGLILRLRISSIPKGTPWIWFTSKEELRKKGFGVRKNTYESQITEGEVLLPPGSIRISGSLKYPSEEQTKLSKDIYKYAKVWKTEKKKKEKKDLLHRIKKATRSDPPMVPVQYTPSKEAFTLNGKNILPTV